MKPTWVLPLLLAPSLGGCLYPELDPHLYVSASFPSQSVSDNGKPQEVAPHSKAFPRIVVSNGTHRWEAYTDAMTFRDPSFGEIRLWRPFGVGPITYNVTLARATCKASMTLTLPAHAGTTITYHGRRFDGTIYEDGPSVLIQAEAPCKATFLMRGAKTK